MNNTNYDKFKKSLMRLQERHNDYLEVDGRPELLPSDIESIQESCIQRFETCFDTLWKHLKKYLEEVTGLPDLPNSPKPLFRIAIENKVMDDFSLWNNYNQKRIATTHDYSLEKASETLNIIPDFIEDAIELYQQMSNETWQ